MVLPVIVLVAEIMGLLVVLIAGLFGRVVLRRPWTVRARLEHGRKERLTASGFRRSGELRDAVAESLRTTVARTRTRSRVTPETGTRVLTNVCPTA